MDVIGALEFSSIASGTLAMDAMVKAAPVRILATRTLCPGKLVIVLTGDEASVGYSLEAGKREGAQHLVDELYIVNLHAAVIPAIQGIPQTGELDAFGVVECLSVTASIRVADIAAKEADIRLLRIRIAGGMGGKSTVKLTGAIHDVQAAVAAGARWAEDRGFLLRQVILPRPHPEIRDFLLDLRPEGAEPWS